MSYTNNVPQANQQIAATQGPILANFQFIQTDAQVEHIFNGNTGPLSVAQAEGTHIQASMCNQNDPVALPTGTNGIYYVSGGVPKYYNTNGAQYIATTGSRPNGTITGTAALTSSPSTIATLPASSTGFIFLFNPASSSVFFCSTFNTSASTANVRSVVSNGTGGLTASGLSLQAAASIATYTYVINYYTA